MRRTPVQGCQVEGEPADVDAPEGKPAGAAQAPESAGVDPRLTTAVPDEVRVRQRGAWIVLAALALAAAAAIIALVTLGGDSTSPTSQSDDIPGQAPVAPVNTDEQKIVETYLGYVQAQNAATEVADPSLPMLAVYTTGEQLQTDADAIKKLRDQGLVTRAPPNSVAEQRVTVESIDGDTARFRSCDIDDGFVVRAATGEPLAPSRVSTGLYVGEMVRAGGGWKVSSLTREEKWEGVAGCAVAG